MNNVMMTKAQDPLGLPRLDSMQNNYQKKSSHNNFRVSEHNRLTDQTGYLAVA